MYTTNAVRKEEITSSIEKHMHRLEEIPDLICDACVVDKFNNLVFLSVWGRDTALQELYSRITLAKKDKEFGLEYLTFKIHGVRTRIYVGNVKELTKRSTRTYKQTKFGTLLHTWIFDKSCIKPDKANHTATVLLEGEMPIEEFAQYHWSVIKDICPLPLLDHWRSEITPLLIDHRMCEDLKTFFGQVGGVRLILDVPKLEESMGDLILRDRLTTYPPYHTGLQH